MRIAVWHNLPFGGGARALYYHLNGLLERGHHIEIWSPDPLINGFLVLPKFVKIHHVPLNRMHRIPIKDRVKSVLFEKDVNIREMEIHCQQCAHEINNGGFDVLFANSCFFYAAPFISRFVNIPRVLYLGEPYRFFFEAHPYSFWEAPEILGQHTILTKKYWWEWLKDIWKTRAARVQLHEERINIESVDTLLVNSYFSSDSCARAYNRMGEVCYLGVDTSTFKPLPDRQTGNYVIGLGSLLFHKNAEIAIRAIAQIEENRPRLVWVSNYKNDNYYNYVLALAQSLHVDLQVREMISDRELVRLLNNAICLVYASKLEPFGLAPLEANACMTPVVGLNQAGIRETILDGETGFLCLTEEEIADKIMYFINNPTERDRMGQTAYENVKLNWTLEDATLRLEKALLRAVRSGSKSSTPTPTVLC
ncbi:glycosyltransferase family 4 protein [Telluribacter humicola]|uniref:glycosyltransferase family 4 protein n=1 Tax=Telluribacter humicola TaxID=1720261 RepID=UPI001A95B5E2|nr:glycosyltransferase [Telluribacter humicola]